MEYRKEAKSLVIMPREWNSGASIFCPVCDSVAKKMNPGNNF